MSRFLGHLAALAAGRRIEGAARPSLPPAFPSPEPDGPAAAPVETGVQADPVGPTTDPVVVVAASLSPGEEQRAGPPVADPRPATPAAPAASRRTLPPSPAGAAAAASFDRPLPPDRTAAEKAASPVQEPRQAVSPGSQAEQEAPLLTRSPAALYEPVSPNAALVSAARPLAPVRSASRDKAGQAETPPAAREAARTPLSDTAVAARTKSPRAAAPVVHVTIDRIEVRAPAPPRPPPVMRRPRPDPGLSLSDFLAAGPPRPRR